MITISFKPKKVTKGLILGLNERAQDVLFQRFGLSDNNTQKKTLDAIGKKYGITRERVRQIENFAINKIKQSPSFETIEDVFTEIKDKIESQGKIVSEDIILDELAKKDESQKNHLHFLLVLGDDFVKLKEDDDFCSRWTVNKEHADKVHASLKGLHKEIKNNDLYSEEDILSILKKHIEKEVKEKVDDAIARIWLDISKVIGKNPMNEWGSVYSPNINPRGMRDYAYLVLRKNGSPLHFTEIAKKISEHFNRNANPSTTHNELIKDNNFVLVGRGLYALKDWGYKTGAVRDVIEDLLKSNGSLTKEEIIKAVMKERYIKENTILVNLQNRDFFTKKEDNRYVITS